MSTFRFFRHAGLVLFTALWMATAHAQTAYESSRLDALQLFGALYQAERLDEARIVLHEYLQRAPCDAVMLYNLACLHAIAGDRFLASGLLDRAFAAGYAPLERTLTDPDLVNLRHVGLLEPIVEHHRARRRALRDAARLQVVEGAWSEAVRLRPEQAACADAGLVVDLRVASDPDGLHLAFDVDTANALHVDVTVGVPRGLDTWETDRVRVLAGPLDGALVMVRWNDERALHRAPRSVVSKEADTVVHTIAWTDLPGIGPPLDAVVALNVRVRAQGDPHGTVALVPDPFLGSNTVPRRRHTDLEIHPDAPAAPWLRGRPLSTSVIGDSLAVDLVAQGLPALDATLRWTLHHRDPVTGEVRVFERPPQARALEPDIAFFASTVGLGGIPAGEVTLDLALEADGFDGATWSTTVLHLDTDWFLRGRRRLKALERASERSIVEYRLFRVLEAVRHAPADDPIAARVAGVAEVETLLERVEATGTPLPEVGDGPSAFDVAFPAGETEMAPGRLVRAARRSRGAPVVLRVSDRLVDPIAARGAEASIDDGVRLEIDVVEDLADPARATTRIGHADRWLRAWAEAEALVVTASGRAVGPTLRGAGGEGRPLRALHLLVDARFDPWPGVDDARLGAALAQRPLEIGILRIGHTADLDAVAEGRIAVLRGAGLDVRTVRLDDEVARRRFLQGIAPN